MGIGSALVGSAVSAMAKLGCQKVNLQVRNRHTMRHDKVVLFDLYGTLVLTHERPEAWDAWHRSLIDSMRSLGGDEKAEEASERLELFWQGDEKPPDNRKTVFEFYISEFVEKLDMIASSRQISKIAGELCDIWQGHLEVDPTAGTMLDRLSQSYRIGLVTNFDHPPHIHRTLKANGLTSRFETIVVSGEAGVKKPDPEILRIACRNIRCDPVNTMYVGDSVIDYEAAAEAGIAPVIIRRPGQGETENTRDRPSKYRDTDRFLYKQAQSGKLSMIGDLREIPDLAAKLLG